MRLIRFLGFLFTLACGLFAIGVVVFGYFFWSVSKDLPSVEHLARYEPPVMTRIHAADGTLLAEYALENRIFVPISKIPKPLIGAFLSAEDKTFYQHAGFDWLGVGYAAFQWGVSHLSGQPFSLRGASTITQQVAKNFFLTSKRDVTRKLKEAALTIRIERAFPKDKILELYLNRIFLGMGSYGVAAAALTYFNCSLDQLTFDQMAYLASLPKGPSSHNPEKNHQRALSRRNWVLGQMLANGYITRSQYEESVKRPLTIVSRVKGAQLFSAQSFVEEVRRELVGLYGGDVLYQGGLSVRATLDPDLQVKAHKALALGLMRFDQKRGWRGPLKHLSASSEEEALTIFDSLKMPDDLFSWRMAFVRAVDATHAEIVFQKKKAEDAREQGIIPLKALTWARWNQKTNPRKAGLPVRKPSDVLHPFDVVYVTDDQDLRYYSLVQVPQIEGALIAMDPHTGRVLALVGGFSYGKSQFNRAVQALRQPGSAIKPFVYAAALENGYTPSSLVLDAPVEVPLGNGRVWRPENYTKKYYGPSTLRLGIEKSRNAMTVNLARDMGVQKFVDLAEHLGIYEHLPPMLSMVLGAGETTLLKMVRAYAVLANGGKEIEATLIDRVQDRYGRTVFKHDQRACTGCVAGYQVGKEPELSDQRPALIDPMTAYQMTLILEGVIERGTGQALKKLGRPIAGKTGTSNDERDAWFIGYTPDLVVGVYVGYDDPQPMGQHATGGELAAPIVARFMARALENDPPIPFRVPVGIQLIPINAKTGKRAAYGEPDVILEAFKPGQDPSQVTRVIGGGEEKGTNSVSPSDLPPQGEGIGTGTGGLY